VRSKILYLRKTIIKLMTIGLELHVLNCDRMLLLEVSL
jgi:hypothetical protein